MFKAGQLLKSNSFRMFSVKPSATFILKRSSNSEVMTERLFTNTLVGSRTIQDVLTCLLIEITSELISRSASCCIMGKIILPLVMACDHIFRSQNK